MLYLPYLNLFIFSQFSTHFPEEPKNSITLDYIFTSIDKKNRSFEIFGSIEDVIPSHLHNVVTKMREFGINDLVDRRKRNREKTYLQDFFNRDELYFILTKSKKNNKNKILEERLYLAKLLLTEKKIKLENLLKRFETNRKFYYNKQKRLSKDGVKEWINYSDSFVKDENRIMNFLTNLNKIKE